MHLHRRSPTFTAPTVLPCCINKVTARPFLTIVCVSRPEQSPNVISSAINIVTSLFRGITPPSTPAPSELPHSKQSQEFDGTELSELQASFDDDDGVDTRRAARKNGTQRALPRVQKRRKSPAFPFFSRPDRLLYPSALLRLSDERILFLLDSAFRRRDVAPANPHLATLLPYDLQRALFDDLTGSTAAKSSTSTASDPPFPASEETSPAGHVAPKRISLWDRTARLAVDVFRFVTMQTGRPFADRPTENTEQSPPPAAAYTAAAMAGDSGDALEAGGDANSAAAAYAAAAAIATSAASSLTHAEREELQAAVSAARAIANADDAAVFVDTIGVTSLVRAAAVLPGTERASALTALANIAIVLPKVRNTILVADEAAIINTIVDTIVRSARFHVSKTVAGSALWYTEALVSGTHLLGSLALTKNASGREFRAKMAKNGDIVRRLERLAGGMKNGESEGSARAARRALGALGLNRWKPRVPGQKGLRILSIDGGGTRAILAFETLKQLKRTTGCEIHELFDIFGGTSTGAIVAASIGLGHKTVEEVELLYRDMIGKVFARHPVNGPKMLLTRAFYDTNVLETTLQRECGRGVFIDSLAEDNMNKVFVVSSVMSRDPKQLFLFRNYTYPLGHESRYDGTTEAQLWEGLRASSAAPTFFSEIRINGELYADGAIVANNPTAVALHESRCMFPGVPIELLVSLGNGLSRAYEMTSSEEGGKKNMGWGDVFGSIVASATSTETVHHAIQDLFPEDKYFRFNPTTDSTQIDETSPEMLATFVKEAQDYIAANVDKFDRVARILRPKTAQSLWQRFRDALSKEIQELESSSWDDDLNLPK